MTHDDLKREIAAAHLDLLDAVNGLPEENSRAPLVYEPWSAADLLAHCIAWDEVTLAGLGALSASEPPELTRRVRAIGAQAYDKEYTGKYARSTPAELLAMLDVTMGEIARAASKLSEADMSAAVKWLWDGEGIGWGLVEAEHFGHKREHAREIAAWRKRNGF